MSRRSERSRRAAGAGSARPPAAGSAKRADAHSAEPGNAERTRGAARTWGLPVQLAFLLGIFAGVTLVAELAGAANLGVALGIGQIAFAIALVYVLVRR